MGKFALIFAAAFLTLVCLSAERTEWLQAKWKNGVDNLDLVIESTREVDSVALYTRIQAKLMAIVNLPAYKQNKSNLIFLIDFKQPSSRNRFYVYHKMYRKIVHAGLVSHGIGTETETPDSLVFSNTPNSHSSSLGLYKIGAPYVGNFGYSYKLHGLEASNSKAFERYVVLHPYESVPAVEQEEPICHSLGCPMLNPQYFTQVRKLIEAEPQPPLLYAYY